jgi:F-type H+-transporting ATPase subunit delta
MSDVIAKKYVKALMNSVDNATLDNMLTQLNSVVPAFSDAKFQNIIFSNEVSKDQKESFILSLFENIDDKSVNFLKLLNTNGRLADIPAITNELQKQISIKNNIYNGKIISDFEVSSDKIKDIESSLSNKLGSTINLENEVTDYPGIKVEIDDLGVEVSFSTDRLKAQMAEHILKSI